MTVKNNSDKSPNIFLITVDDLRADRLYSLGYSKMITPNIDIFAEQNIFFTNAYAVGPMTPLSFSSILFSLYPYEYFKDGSLNQGLASVLQELGYKTAAFNSKPHFIKWGFRHGFEYFENFLHETGQERNKLIE